MTQDNKDLPQPISHPHIEVGTLGIAVIHDDFDRGLDPNVWSTQRIEPGRWSFGQQAGRKAVRIELRQGNKKETNRWNTVTERAELSENPAILLPLGVNAWYAFSFYFPPDFPTLDNRTVFAQLKQSTPQAESPFFSLRYINGQLISKVVGDPQTGRIKFCQKGEWRAAWHDVLVNYQINPDQQGFVTAQIDGQPFVGYRGKMGYPSVDRRPYFKMGLYRDTIDTPQTIFFSRFRRGLSREDCTT